MKRFKISLIISTYNRPDALEACLESVRRQKMLPSEVIIADDGSGKETARTIARLQNNFPVPVHHVWHNDDGFRLAKIRNKAIALAMGEYIVQTDGDIILHPLFIADHYKFARNGNFVKGVRVRLNEEYSNFLCKHPRLTPKYLYLKKNVYSRHKAIRFTPIARWFAAHFKKNKAYALGCNMGFWKSDLYDVNGYDEAFEGWGREDDDIAHRLFRNGIKMRDVRFAAICAHLWHPENSKENWQNNIELCMSSDQAGCIKAEKGLNQYLFHGQWARL